MADKKRKYVLFNKNDGRPDSVKPCAFFLSSAGCRNGANCAFSHDVNASNDSKPVEENDDKKKEKKEKKTKHEKGESKAEEKEEHAKEDKKKLKK